MTLQNSTSLDKFLWPLLLLLCMLPIANAPIALVVGIVLSFAGIRPIAINARKITSPLLQASVVLMGFGMNLHAVIQTTQTSFWVTALSVSLTLAGGVALGYLFRVDRITSVLISCGTAICGGSAIAAISPIVSAKENQISFALAVVFVLNSVALVVFPLVGQSLNIPQEAFGYWAAIAIHDTSSVVGAGAAYGEEALQVAATVKLTRALWIIPLSLVVAFFYRKSNGVAIKVPWFIGLFVVAIVVAYLIPQWETTFNHLHWLGKRGMVIALLLIGNGLSVEHIRRVGVGAFAMGVLLWVVVSVVSLLVFM